MRRFAKGIIANLLWNLGEYRKALHGLKAPMILKYHRVSLEARSAKAARDYTDFERGHYASVLEAHAQLLLRYRRPISMDELVEALALGKSLPERAVAVTFDDGYEDTYNIAAPILKRYGIPATVYVCPGLIDSGSGFWWDHVVRYFRHTQHRDFVLTNVLEGAKVDVKAALPRLYLRNIKTKHLAAERVIKIFKGMPESKLPQLMKCLLEELGLSQGKIPTSNHALLSWSQIREMSEDGMDIGSHTMTHPMLSHLTEHQIREEFANANQRIFEVVRQPVRGLVYPSGDYNESCGRIAMECGLRYACTSNPGFVTPASETYFLKRIELPNAGIAISVRDILLTWRYVQSNSLN